MCSRITWSIQQRRQLQPSWIVSMGGVGYLPAIGWHASIRLVHSFNQLSSYHRAHVVRRYSTLSSSMAPWMSIPSGIFKGVLKRILEASLTTDFYCLPECEVFGTLWRVSAWRSRFDPQNFWTSESAVDQSGRMSPACCGTNLRSSAQTGTTPRSTSTPDKHVTKYQQLINVSITLE